MKTDLLVSFKYLKDLLKDAFKVISSEHTCVKDVTGVIGLCILDCRAR